MYNIYNVIVKKPIMMILNFSINAENKNNCMVKLSDKIYHHYYFSKFVNYVNINQQQSKKNRSEIHLVRAVFYYSQIHSYG